MVLTASVELIASIALIACGGGDDEGGGGGGGGDVSLDPNRADAIAHAAMLQTGDLPGSGWKVAQTDNFSESSFGDIGGTGSCKTLNDKVEASRQSAESARAGRAATEFTKESGLVPTSLEITVNVYRTTEAPEEAMKAFKDALGGDDFGKCLNDSLKEGFSGGDAKLNVKSAKAGTSAPNDGLAKAYDIDIEASGLKASFRAEFYAWQYDNSGNTIFIFGSKEDLNGDLQKAAVSKTQEKLENAN